MTESGVMKTTVCLTTMLFFSKRHVPDFTAPNHAATRQRVFHSHNLKLPHIHLDPRSHRSEMSLSSLLTPCFMESICEIG